MKTYNSLSTNQPITWCPGCPNFMILESVKQAIGELVDKKKLNREEICLITDVGCNSKIYDYIDLSGIYGLHGRSLAIAEGVYLGNPKLKVLAFQGDGGAYSEGIEHFIHSFRHNFPITLIVHENQTFSLTTGQPTPTTQKNFKSKINPSGEKLFPINPIKIALASGAKFIARCNAKDIVHTKEVLQKAIEYSGFSFIEIIQECLIFNPSKEVYKLMYKIPDNFNKKKAEILAEEWDYNRKDGKIPLGIIWRDLLNDK
jgi:2-oxoglutarate/2-oxoacid ferredoxin oxidoreductase subunit beta